MYPATVTCPTSAKEYVLSSTLVAAGAAFALTVLLMPAVLRWLRRVGAWDIPNQRSSHRATTLRGGGIAPWLASLVTVGVAPGISGHLRIALLLAAGGLGLLGVTEDLRGLSAGRRFLAQVFVACIAAYAMHPLLDSVIWSVLVLPAVVLWIVAYVNAFNFMDGINGVSAAQAVAAGAGFAVMGWQAGAAELTVAGGLVAGAALAFAPFNFPKARVFLGDAGSYFLGGWLALLGVVALVSRVPPESVAAPFLVYLADTGTTLGKRVLRREPWHQPHRSHVYQRLTQLGWSHAMTAGWVLATITGCIALGVAAIDATPLGRVTAGIGMGAFVTLYLATPGLVARFSTRPMARL